MEDLVKLLAHFEGWAADVLESHLSYPVLAFYRSQHDRESWLYALTAVLDTCALIRLRFENDPEWERRLGWQAYLTFAMARHTIVDLALVFNIEPVTPTTDRLPPDRLEKLRAAMATAGIPLRCDDVAEAQLRKDRALYEPYVTALAERFVLSLPPWMPETDTADNWQTSAWSDIRHF